MSEARDELRRLFESWELRIDQAQRDEEMSPGEAEELRKCIYTYVGDALRIVSKEAARWTSRPDDAMRIPDVIREHADWLLGSLGKAADAVGPRHSASE